MFEGWDAVVLARAQFAFTVSFHIIFPAFSIGLASYLAVLEALWLWTGRDVYLNLFNYWKTIFAVAFGMGVVSGIVMSYQFGTNWAGFSDKAGPVIGPLMGYEVLHRLLPRSRLPRRHAVRPQTRRRRASTCSPSPWSAIGTLISATWILAANSWMQTPAGFAIADERPVHARPTGGRSSSTRASPTGSSTRCWRPTSPRPSRSARSARSTCCSDNANRHARVMFSMAMWMAALVTPMQIFAGDQHGLNTLEHQPAKIAAMEGHYETHTGRAADPVRHPRRQGRRRRTTRSKSPSSARSSSRHS